MTDLSIRLDTVRANYEEVQMALARLGLALKAAGIPIEGPDA